MSDVHIANTDVEFEYAGQHFSSLEECWSHYSLCLQLQFLPLLYAAPDDLVAVTTLPDPGYLTGLEKTRLFPCGIPRLALLHEKTPFAGLKCVSWGHSLLVKNWAEARGMRYAIPRDWSLISQLNSKEYSLQYTCLANAALLLDEPSLLAWIQKVPGKKVLKSCFGLSGRGNLLFDDTAAMQKLLLFCHKEWKHNRPLIGEPWLERVADFSTQWIVHPDQQIEFVGATRFDTDARGTYRGTLAGPDELLFGSYLPFLHPHRLFVDRVLQEMAGKGYFGRVGFDAFIYNDPATQGLSLYPLVEINCRQTMSLVALNLQQRHCPNRVLRLAFDDASGLQQPLLPNQLEKANGKRIKFIKNLSVFF